MLSTATAGIIRIADSRGALAVLEIGRDRRFMAPVSFRQGAMWPVGHALILPRGHEWCQSATKHGWTTLLSGEYRFRYTPASRCARPSLGRGGSASPFIRNFRCRTESRNIRRMIWQTAWPGTIAKGQAAGSPFDERASVSGDPLREVVGEGTGAGADRCGDNRHPDGQLP
jgi:hypothetical protein